MTPAVSVLLPFYNAERWLAEATDSILADGLADLELLLLDDGSADGGPAIAEAITRRDPRARLLRGGRRGLVATLNAGIAEARAPHIARMDADDVSLPGRLSAQAAFLEAHPRVAAVDGRVTIFRDDGPLLGGMAAFQRWLDSLEDHASIRANLFVDSPLVHPATMIRAQALRAAGGYREGVAEDYDLWLRLAAAGHHLHKLPQRVLRWRDHGARLTRTDAVYARRAMQALKWSHLQALGALVQGRPVAVWGAGKEARPWLRALAEGGWEVTGVVDIDPRKQGTTRHGFPTYPVEALPELGWHRCLVAVGARGARDAIREIMAREGIPEAPTGDERGYTCVA